MIRNIIFDMVGVLMRFDTESYIEEHHLSEADVAILRKEVFRSLEWAMQDRGSISTEEAERRICGRVPAHLHFAVHDLLYREGRKIVPIDGMRELLQDLKVKGFRAYGRLPRPMRPCFTASPGRVMRPKAAKLSGGVYSARLLSSQLFRLLIV